MSSIQVCIRMRPLLPEEDSPERQRIILLEKQGKVKVELTEQKEKMFKFNHVLNQQVKQQELYSAINIEKLVERVVQGYHSTLFAYGQTGSGKTYTIQGGQSEKMEGIIPKAIRDIFQLISDRVSNNVNERGYRIYLSFIQIYNEAIYDLIDPGQGKPLKMRWNKSHQFTVQNLFQSQCRTAEQALKWWKKGQKNKIMGSHKMNNSSSRSHCMLTLRLQNYSLEDPSDQIESKLEIVDLAGSERYKVTKSQGVAFREGIEINKSLFTLRQVIASLYESSTAGKSGLLPPYRDSKLTCLLKQSIGGNSYCLMIACLNPSMAHFEESLQTLTYASMATYINNAPTVNIQCIQCNRRKEGNELNELKEGSQPLGIVSLPRIQDKGAVFNRYEHINPSYKQLSSKQGIQFNKSLKSTKQIFESIAIIRDLTATNSLYRQKIEFYKNFIENQQKEIFNLMKENQSLRQRYSSTEAVNRLTTEPTYFTQLSRSGHQMQPNIKNNNYRLKSLSKNHNIIKRSQRNEQSITKISYNDFLKGKSDFQRLGNKRRMYSQKEIE